MKMWETKCSGCGKMVPANQCPQLRMIPLCKPCWVKKNNEYYCSNESIG